MTQQTKQKDNDEIIAAYLKKIQIEKEQIEGIIAQTEALEIEQKRRRQLLGSNDAKESRMALQNQIRMLENRLNDALVKFNTKVQENKKLRDLIGAKRRDRCLYDEIYSKLENQILAQSQQMHREVEQGKKTGELREQAQATLAMAKKELQEGEANLDLARKELGDLREKIDNMKERPRSCRPKTTPASSSSSSSALSTEEEEHCNDYVDDIYEEKTLDELLQKVLQASGMDNADALIERLQGSEERNLSRFQHITELEAEIGRAEDDIVHATKELERMKNRCVNRQMQQHNERELAKQQRQTLNYEIETSSKHYESQVELWEKMRAGIAQVHSELELPAPDGLLGSDGVSESNVFGYLAEIEKKTTQIISAINSDYDEDEGATSPSPVACRSRSHSFAISKAALNLNLPSVKDAPTDDGDRPFTFEELKSSLQF